MFACLDNRHSSGLYLLFIADGANEGRVAFEGTLSLSVTVGTARFWELSLNSVPTYQIMKVRVVNARRVLLEYLVCLEGDFIEKAGVHIVGKG
jgi:hypothetical protein